MPDFDIDFCMLRRQKVIGYVRDKYGHDVVAQIATMGTIGARSAVHDATRALGRPYPVGGRIAKAIPSKPSITLAEAYNDAPALDTLRATDKDAREILVAAEKIEGLARSVGTHAGGLVIAPSNITDFAPLYREGPNAAVITMFQKDDVEDIGLVKFDFLGLRTLTALNWATRRLKTPELTELPLDDPKTLGLFRSGETIGVFQFESPGMRQLMVELEPSRFEDLVALTALYRPGPLQSGMVKDFINRKHGRAAVVYPHPALEPVLNETYGTFVYQEQVMEAANVLAGFSLAEADILRRAMGKKKADEMARQRQKFVDGCKATKDIAPADANAIYDLIEGFAGYGFNKSHSVAYTLLSWQAGYLKAHAPATHMACVASSEICGEGADQSKGVRYLKEAKRLGIEIVPPDINFSGGLFSVLDNPPGIRFGLLGVRDLGVAAVRAILGERKSNGAFLSMADLCARVKVPKNGLKALVESGALDAFGGRAELEAWMPQASKGSRNVDMWEMPSAVVDPWVPGQAARREKAALGMYLSGHPVDVYRPDAKAVGAKDILDVVAQAEEDEGTRRTVTIVGSIGDRQERTGRGGIVSILELEDASGQVSVVVEPEVHAVCEGFLGEENVVLVEGTVSKGRGQKVRVRAQRVSDMETLRQSRATSAEWTPHAGVDTAPMRKIIEGASPGRCLVKGFGKAVSPSIELVQAMESLGSVVFAFDEEQKSARKSVTDIATSRRDNATALEENRAGRHAALAELEGLIAAR